IQHRGTATLGRVFGPVMITWFVTIGGLGIAQIVREPGVTRAVNPVRGVQFFADNGFRGFLALGAVILVVVGGEALYADLGHFGRRPITLGWYALVLPSLLLCYFGQGALLLADPADIDNPFYRMAPDWAIIPLVLLATMATVIASQALISAAFSLTRQAAQLGYLPRVHVRHTSASEIGQIYIGSVNWLLMVVCIALVLGFRESVKLAGAYGLAVSTTMTITTVIFFFVARERSGWPRPRALALCGLFLVIDLAFLGSTLFKIPHGGWLPLVIAALVFTVLSTWRTGRRLVGERLLRGGMDMAHFIESLHAHPPTRTRGAAAYLYSGRGVTPPALIAALRHTHVLPETVLVVAIVTAEIPRVPPDRRAEVTDLGDGFHQVVLHFGFIESPEVPTALAGRALNHLGIDLSSISYVLGAESLRVTARPGMVRWREHLFAALSRNSTSAADYFCLPFDQTLVLGITVEL
ncbi:MAG TPA: KUP/HAK/KT family potassium transporter, partial [Acidimicrobiales bacterium]